MRKIRVAQIGTSKNSHGNDVFRTIVKNSDVFEVVGYAFPENEREKFPANMSLFEGHREMTVDEILNDPTIEAVCIETEEIYLTKYALAAARAGKHIHMEKPGGLSLDGFEELISIMKMSGKVFHTGYMYRYNPAVIDAIRRVRSGELGKIIYVEAHMDCLHPENTRKWLSSFGGGMTFFLGCHLIDLVYSIMGEPDEIMPLNTCSGMGISEGEDIGFVLYKYGNAYSFIKTAAVEVGGFLRRQLVIAGEKGSIEIKPLEEYTPDKRNLFSTTRRISVEEAMKGWNELGSLSKTEPHNRYKDMMCSFASFVRGDRENPYTLDYELALYKLLLRSCKNK